MAANIKKKSSPPATQEIDKLNGDVTLRPDQIAGDVIHDTVIPLFLVVLCPWAVELIWMCCEFYDGSIWRMLTEATFDGVLASWPWPTWTAAKIILWFALLELVLMVGIPGKKHLGPVTPSGNRPSYRLNGVASYFLTHIILYICAFQLNLFSPGIIYDNFGNILSTLSLFSFLACFALYLKGKYWPTDNDNGLSGNFIMDFFWGVELHPHFMGFNLKQYCNCRLGMMSWSVLILAFTYKQYELYGFVSNSMLVSTLIQVVYIIKFFWWESGYFASLDIMHDRFGFYIYWGVTVWVPSVYTLVSFYLTKHPIQHTALSATFLLFLGLFAIWANYDADAQRQRVRESNGQCTVWRQQPRLLKAKYFTSDGNQRENLLLMSGWWGVSRHIHYVAEITLSLAWTLPATFDNALPYFYVCFLTILLVHRSLRDEERCSLKYGEYWEQYKKNVPYKIIPGIF